MMNVSNENDNNHDRVRWVGVVLWSIIFPVDVVKSRLAVSGATTPLLAMLASIQRVGVSSIIIVVVVIIITIIIIMKIIFLGGGHWS